MLQFKALQLKLAEEKAARQKADTNSQDKERQMSMLSVDYRQIQQRLQKLEGEYRQETEKTVALHAQIEQDQIKKSILLSDISVHCSDYAHLKVRERQLVKDIAQLREAKKKSEDDLVCMRQARNADELQIKELTDQFEAEQYFSRLYKTQSSELRDENEEKARAVHELEEERSSLLHQLQLALARADSEALARSIAEETVADLEKEKTIKELELKDLLAKHRGDLGAKDAAMLLLRDTEADLNKELHARQSELSDAHKAHAKLHDELQTNRVQHEELEKLRVKVKQEVLLKQTAVNKLAEIMNRKDATAQAGGKSKVKVNSADLRKKEKESRRLQQELTQEREKYNQLLLKLQDVQSQLNDEIHAKTKLQMNMECKATEIEHLQMKLNETASLSSADNDADDNNQDSVFEGWLSVPNKQNIRRHGWKRQFVVVSTRRIIFYQSEVDKQNTSDPLLIIDLSKVFHVRSVTQGDVIRADAKEIPRIFQLLYAVEGEARRPDEASQLDISSLKGGALDERPGTKIVKGE